MKNFVRLSAVFTLGSGVIPVCASIVNAHDEKRIESAPAHEVKHAESSSPSPGGHALSSSFQSPGDAILGSLLEAGFDAVKKIKLPVHFHSPSMTRSSSTNTKTAPAPSPAQIERPLPANSSAAIVKSVEGKEVESPHSSKQHRGKPPSGFAIKPLPLKDVHLSSKGHQTSKVNADYAFPRRQTAR